MKVLAMPSKYPSEYSGSGVRVHRTRIQLKKIDANSKIIPDSAECKDQKQFYDKLFKVGGLFSNMARLQSF